MNPGRSGRPGKKDIPGGGSFGLDPGISVPSSSHVHAIESAALSAESTPWSSRMTEFALDSFTPPTVAVRGPAARAPGQLPGFKLSSIPVQDSPFQPPNPKIQYSMEYSFPMPQSPSYRSQDRSLADFLQADERDEDVLMEDNMFSDMNAALDDSDSESDDGTNPQKRRTSKAEQMQTVLAAFSIAQGLQ
ncbi:hypothetical protein C8J56DRAFT_1083760 [Mycena floridula]|nr:hypothetical protein C8J56DRAFT_1083760 [Mycena floridula]